MADDICSLEFFFFFFVTFSFLPVPGGLVRDICTASKAGFGQANANADGRLGKELSQLWVGKIAGGQFRLKEHICRGRRAATLHWQRVFVILECRDWFLYEAF